MDNLILYRNLPFKTWHTPFSDKGSKWKQGGVRDECSCPYGKHGDRVFLDHKDPLHLSLIFSIEPGRKLLLFCDPHGNEKVKLRIFESVDIVSDAIRMRFEKVVQGLCWDHEWLTGIRWIAVLPDNNQTTVFEKEGGLELFTAELTGLIDIPAKLISEEIAKIQSMPIDDDLHISSNHFMESVRDKPGVEIYNC
jgi:hypothetical protein